MENEFWVKRWTDRNISFHEEGGNELLKKNLLYLSLQTNDRLLLPLCGMSLDIDYLLNSGFRVIGVELFEKAVIELFSRLNIEPKIRQLKNCKSYYSESLEILVGDLFQIDKDEIGHVDAVYDRASLVALPHTMREKYYQHIMHISKLSPQLLITYLFEDNNYQSPPFSIEDHEIESSYSQYSSIELKEVIRLSKGLKGCSVVDEKIWLMK
ncbi:MAG: thiopurine S-methyltransferase [Halobacteriovoraceae bacterium]|nr:thiopurine S-methyltransferase [Halobacteriovoraceae bacterium]